MARKRSTERLPSDTDQNRGEIATAYWDLYSLRQPFLDRARDCARLTIPTLIPPQNFPAKNYRYATPYQSIGARAVNHLASKLIVALFPPSAPFFRFSIDDETVKEQMQRNKDTKGMVEQALAKIERGVMSRFEKAALRVQIHLALKHLIVGGNGLLYIEPKTYQGKFLPLSRYVVRRDPMGNVLEIVTMEDIDEEALPEDLKRLEESAEPKHDEATEHSKRTGSTPETVAVYTQVLRCEKKWEVRQEVEGRIKLAGTYDLDKCPYLPLRMIAADGEDYGRSPIEEYYGDLSSLEKLSKAIVQFAAAAAKILFLVKPNANTNPKKLAKAVSGDFVQGNREDISTLQIEKYNDFQVAKATADGITERLSYAFLMNSAVQRNAERVTAAEIRLMAQELDTGFGGIFATLSQELQLPVVSIIVANMQRNKEIPPIPHAKKIMRPTVITGLEALGRSKETDNLLSAFSVLGQYPALVQKVDLDEFARRVFTGFGVDPEGLIRTAEDVQSEMQNDQAAQAFGPAGAEAVKAYARHAGKLAAEGNSPKAAIAALSPSTVEQGMTPMQATQGA